MRVLVVCVCVCVCVCVKTAASMFHKICYGNRDGLVAGIICAGWDPVDGGQVSERVGEWVRVCVCVCVRACVCALCPCLCSIQVILIDYLFLCSCGTGHRS